MGNILECFTWIGDVVRNDCMVLAQSYIQIQRFYQYKMVYFGTNNN